MTRKRWRNPDKRMALAVEMRQRGWSLRRIGRELAVSVGTVHADLARWHREQTAEMEELAQLVQSDCSVDGGLNTGIEHRLNSEGER